MTNYVCTYNEKKWEALYKIIEKSDKYSLLKIESKFKDLEIFLWHSQSLLISYSK